MINYNFKIEFTKMRTIYSDIVFTSGDVRGYKLWFEFTDHGKKVDVSNCLLTLKALRSDGIIVTDMGVFAENGQMYYEVKNSMISKEGEVKFEIALSDKSGMYVTTKEIVATVRKGYGDGDVDAENTTPVLSTLLNAASACVAAAKTAEEIAEIAKATAENAETTAENAETTAENAKVAAENAKITIDDALDEESENVVQNKVIKAELDKKIDESRISAKDRIDIHETWGINILGDAHCADMARKDSDGEYITERYIEQVEQNEEELIFHTPYTAHKYVVRCATPEYVNGQIGEIETALDNIIAKYGLGGESV